MILLDISSWWQALTSMEKIFWGISLLFSALFLIQLVLSFIAGDGDSSLGDADEYISGDEGMGHQFFTIKNLIAFFTIFGWTGIACLKGGMSKGIAIAIAVLAGSLVVIIMAFLFKSMSKLKQSGTLQIKNAVGLIAETYLFIPPKRGGFGKVHVKVQGSLHELQAITDDEEQIATGKLVKITAVINDAVLLVTSKLS
ncbi:MAG TPA: hypothetical protein PK977_01645 [Chitinophagaceae bacterium]|nr:hypothetical protein [Chitinophagaceae bacterium]HRF16833.1 hypothetical protein [Chitinophagaceae bacterium]